MNRGYLSIALLVTMSVTIGIGLAGGTVPLLRSMDTEYANTYAKDMFTDAPWFIRDSSVPLPVIFIIKDTHMNDEARILRYEAPILTTSGFAPSILRIPSA